MRTPGKPLAIASGAVLAITAVATAMATSVPRLSIRLKPRATYYSRPSPNFEHVSGQLSTMTAGVRVELEASVWPFNSSFSGVGHGVTKKGGIFSFEKKLAVATELRVAAQQSTVLSAVRTAYVFPGYENTHCTITRGSTTFPCSGQLAPGVYTVRFTYEYVYPASAYRREKRKRVYLYFGQLNGVGKPPKKLTLQRTVAQHPRRAHRTQVVLTHTITIPPTAWNFYIRGCTRTSMQTDGLGLPGRPGSHHCGDKVISLRQARGQLG